MRSFVDGSFNEIPKRLNGNIKEPNNWLAKLLLLQVVSTAVGLASQYSTQKQKHTHQHPSHSFDLKLLQMDDLAPVLTLEELKKIGMSEAEAKRFLHLYEQYAEMRLNEEPQSDFSNLHPLPDSYFIQ